MKMPVTHLTSLMEINESKSYLSYLLILFLPNLTSSVLFFLTAIIMSFVEKEMATHSVVLAWRIPGTEEPGGLPSVGSPRVGHD